MEIQQIRDDEKGCNIYILIIPDSDFIRCKFFRHDWWLFNECEQSKRIADKLLALETIALRVESDIEL